MKRHLEQLLATALSALVKQGKFPASPLPTILVERTKDKQHGDFASNLALLGSKQAACAPRELAAQLIAYLPSSDQVQKVEIAGPGFINFYLKSDAAYRVIADIFKEGDRFGACNVGQGQRVHMEYVSANPTGPLHVGHGRGAAYGASLANLLTLAGFVVHREYYVNDAGRQMDILATSVWLRYLELAQGELTFPSNGYQGVYVIDIARNLLKESGSRFVKKIADVFSDLPLDAQEDGTGDKEIYIDALIERAKNLLGEADYRIVHAAGLDAILSDIRDDLAEFRVTFDEWFSERSLHDGTELAEGIERLKKTGYCYEQNGALWFRSTDLDDEKDRVIVRENGQPTYFASDIAYHLNKFNRGFDQVIDILGADHHGYVPRIKALLQALGIDPDRLKAPLVQFATLYRGDERVQMSTRSGSFVTLRELREEVGNDAARFFYVMRKSEQHMDFDLDLAKSQSQDNPVYYIQYAHARICSVMRQLVERKLSFDQDIGLAHLSRLVEPHELTLITQLGRYSEIIEMAARHDEPHHIAHYLRDLANELHTYYNAHAFLVEDDLLRCARLCLVQATRQVLSNGLALLGVSAPESM